VIRFELFEPLIKRPFPKVENEVEDSSSKENQDDAK
jgi:hypothetical protein